MKNTYCNVLSPEERHIYEVQAEISMAASAVDGVTSASPLDPVATCLAVAPYNEAAATASLAPPTSVALWFQQPSLQPQDCAEPSRRTAAALKSTHPISTHSFDAVKPDVTQKDINDYHDEFKRATGQVPTAHPGIPKKVTYLTCCCELCRKRAPLPHAYLVGLGIIQAAQYKHKI